MSVMKASELVKKHIDVAKNYKTVYMWGCFGSPVTDGIITEKAKQYPDWYDAGNAVPDVSADGMIAKCKDVSASGWDKLVPGEGLWMPGHWGMYIGDGLAVECTPIWDNGVQITCVGNIGLKGGYNSRVWKKHGKLPWVEYDTETVDRAVEDAKATIKAKAGLADGTIDYLAAYKYGADLLKKLAAAMK